MVRSLLSLAAVVLTASLASAQSLGTFKWQLQPFCNVVTVNVTGVAGVYTVEGFDDQCGAPTRAPLTGVATPNPDGSIGFGLNIVSTPGGRGIQVDARIAIATLGGSWSDSAGHSGTFAFNANTGGSPRPLPTSGSIIPPTISFLSDGGVLAKGLVGAGAAPASGPGARMMWHSGKAAFRAGQADGQEWDAANTGAWSAAFGKGTTASGNVATAFGTATAATGIGDAAFGHRTLAAGGYSVALGEDTKATGYAALALGVDTEASGQRSLAGGLDSRAQGFQSLAFGAQTIANGVGSIALSGGTSPGAGVVVDGNWAVAIGSGLDAAGAGSIVLGSNASTTQAAHSSFVFGDSSTVNTIQSFAPNEFKVRAAGGTYIYSHPTLAAGVRLAPGTSAWSTLSDVNSKENFRDLDSRDLLTKLASMSIREWNYKTQDTAIRHAGPTAQDFYAAFGLGEDPLRISTIDADGIALAGVSALARENAALKSQLAAQQVQLAALQARLDQLEAGKR